MKTFLKPTKTKILLMLIVPLYIGFVVDVSTVNGVEEVTKSWAFTPFPYVTLLVGIIALAATRGDLFSGIESFSFLENVWYISLEALLPLVINYLLACALVCLAKKFWHRFHKTSAPQHQKSVPKDDTMKL